MQLELSYGQVSTMVLIVGKTNLRGSTSVSQGPIHGPPQIVKCEPSSVDIGPNFDLFSAGADLSPRWNNPSQPSNACSPAPYYSMHGRDSV